ncbi:MAG: hypothetical protein U0796_12255 [Gemmatales bacterium]
MSRISVLWTVLLCLLAPGCQLLSTAKNDHSKAQQFTPGHDLAELVTLVEPGVRQAGLLQHTSLQRTFVMLDGGDHKSYLQAALIAPVSTSVVDYPFGALRIRNTIPYEGVDWKNTSLSMGWIERDATKPLTQKDAEALESVYPLPKGSKYSCKLVLDSTESFVLFEATPSQTARAQVFNVLNDEYNRQGSTINGIDKLGWIAGVFPILCLKRYDKNGTLEEYYLSIDAVTNSIVEVRASDINLTWNRLQKLYVQPDDEIEFLTASQFTKRLMTRYGTQLTAKNRHK